MKENEANARLIAAAPELLETVKAFFDCFSTPEPSTKNEEYAAAVAIKRAIEKGRIAIARAEGTQPEQERAPIDIPEASGILDSTDRKLIAYMAEDDGPSEPDPTDLYREWKDAQDDADQPTPYDP